MIPFAGIMEQQPELSTAGDFLLSVPRSRRSLPFLRFREDPLRDDYLPRDKPIEVADDDQAR